MIDITAQFRGELKDAGQVQGIVLSQYTITSLQIDRQMQECQARLNSLSDHISKMTLFEEQNSNKQYEIQQLIIMLKDDIHQLQTQMEQLQHILTQLRLSPEKRSYQHYFQVLTGLRSQLAEMVKSFEGILALRTEVLKRNQVPNQSLGISKLQHKSKMEYHDLYDDSEMNDLEDGQGQAGKELSIQIPRVEEMTFLSRNDQYLNSRTEEVEKIERTVEDVQRIYARMSELVAVQDESIMRISQNVEQSVMNVEAAQNELLKYLQGISGNRGLITKMLGVMVVFMVAFVLLL